MASPKPPTPSLDTTASGKQRWMAKFRVGDKRLSVGLNVPGPGNKREAQAWATRIHLEIVGGRLTEEVAEQIGQKQASRIGRELAAANAGEAAIDLTSWAVARDAWLAATAAKDSVSQVHGKVAAIARTRKDRQSRTSVFVRWAHETGALLDGSTPTRTLSRYVEDRLASGLSVATVQHDLRILGPWFRFLSKRGVIAPPDMEKVAEKIPPEEPADPWLPDWELDLLVLKAMHEARFESPYHEAAWSCFLLCRGIGCRPTEAISLTWNSIDLDADEVLFLDTKDSRLKGHKHRHRRTPILLQWAHDGLEELFRLRGKGGRLRAVCQSTRGRPWSSEAMSAKAFRRIMDRLALPKKFVLKTSQKCQMRHLRWLGFPADEIVRWAGHSRRVHDSWYDRENATLVRPPADRDYGRFDALTDYGRWALDPARGRRL